jgi:hypothetical protein
VRDGAALELEKQHATNTRLAELLDQESHVNDLTDMAAFEIERLREVLLWIDGFHPECIVDASKKFKELRLWLPHESPPPGTLKKRVFVESSG